MHTISEGVMKKPFPFFMRACFSIFLSFSLAFAFSVPQAFADLDELQDSEDEAMLENDSFEEDDQTSEGLEEGEEPEGNVNVGETNLIILSEGSTAGGNEESGELTETDTEDAALVPMDSELLASGELHFDKEALGSSGYYARNGGSIYIFSSDGSLYCSEHLGAFKSCVVTMGSSEAPYDYIYCYSDEKLFICAPSAGIQSTIDLKNAASSVRADSLRAAPDYFYIGEQKDGNKNELTALYIFDAKENKSNVDLTQFGPFVSESNEIGWHAQEMTPSVLLIRVNEYDNDSEEPSSSNLNCFVVNLNTRKVISGKDIFVTAFNDSEFGYEKSPDTGFLATAKYFALNFRDDHKIYFVDRSFNALSTVELSDESTSCWVAFADGLYGATYYIGEVFGQGGTPDAKSNYIYLDEHFKPLNAPSSEPQEVIGRVESETNDPILNDLNLKISKISAPSIGTVWAAIQDLFSRGHVTADPYEIHFEDKDGAKFEWKDGRIRVFLPIPVALKSLLDTHDLVVYYVGDDGSIEEMVTSVHGDELAFDTTHLSHYVVATKKRTEGGSSGDTGDSQDGIQKQVSTSSDQNNANSEASAPKTGDNSINMVIGFGSATFAAFAAALLFASIRRRRMN